MNRVRPPEASSSSAATTSATSSGVSRRSARRTAVGSGLATWPTLTAGRLGTAVTLTVNGVPWRHDRPTAAGRREPVPGYAVRAVLLRRCARPRPALQPAAVDDAALRRPAELGPRRRHCAQDGCPVAGPDALQEPERRDR